MAVLPILCWPDARLSVVCAPVTNDAHDLAANMLDTMYAATGRGLAAPQVGALVRLFVMDVTWKDGTTAPQVFVNPRFIWRSDRLIEGPEGCLSLPGLSVKVSRSDCLRLQWETLDGLTQEAEFDGFAAICIQHECDHLDGILTTNHLTAANRAIAEKTLQ